MAQPERWVVGVAARFVSAMRNRGMTVSAVVLFGSQATGIATEDSDIDLAIFSPSFGGDRMRDTTQLTRIRFDVDHRIAPVAYHPDAIKTTHAGEFLHDEVLGKGIILWPTERQGEGAAVLLQKGRDGGIEHVTSE